MGQNSNFLIAAVTSCCLVVITVERNRRAFSKLPPKVFCQRTWRNDAICSLLSKFIYRRVYDEAASITSMVITSLWASSGSYDSVKFREVLKLPSDGEHIALDWEFPTTEHTTDLEQPINSIQHPVAIIIPALGTDSEAGYIRSAMTTFVKLGYVSVVMNYRGFGGVKPLTPRIANPINTMDLRVVVTLIANKIQPGQQLFLVGYGLGGYMISKYLGEECRCRTLNKHIHGGVGIMAPIQLEQAIPSMENKSPTTVHNTWNDSFKDVLNRQWSEYYQFQCQHFQTAFRKAMDPKSTTKDSYAHLSPYLSRNKIDNFDSSVVTAIGYHDMDHFLQEGCSLEFIPHISIPFLFIIDNGDPMISSTKCNYYYYVTAASNPNIFLIETDFVEHRRCIYSTRPNCVTLNNYASDTAAAFAKAIVTLREDLWFPNNNLRFENTLHSRL